ncbi:MAG: FHA domain-containing protein [Prevotella sp.]|jgi:hypothetical protein|nr:FHA domain-containing protein [Prevotella sp.]
MKRILLFCLSLLCFSIQAQDTGAIRDGFNVDDFPRITFVYHDYTPQLLDKSDFQYLKERGENRNFDLVVLQEDHLQESQTTLFLWEDMAHNGRGQFEFTQKVLSGFFDGANIPAGNRFAVSVFNRRKNRPSALYNLTNGFTDDKTQIEQAIQNYRHSTEHYPEFPNRSDMYSAIREGLDMLQPLDGVKSIVVFTAGYSMKNSGSDSESQVLLQAQRLHIPVYIVQYYYKSGVAPESEGFAKSSNGSFNSYMDIAPAKTDLIGLYPEMRERYYGHSYKISFKSNAQRGEEARTISLKIRGTEIQEQFLPPPFSLKEWVKENIWLFVGLVVAFIGLVISIVWFIRKKIAERDRKIAENGVKLQNEISASNQALADMKRQQEIKERQQQAEIARKTQEAEEKRLARLMQTKNLFPRLQCRAGNNGFTYTINKPLTTLGRDAGNDVVLNNQTVSGFHAEISFTGGAFEIANKSRSYKQGIIVNGQFFQQATLKNGDIIGLGEAVITFYV